MLIVIGYRYDRSPVYIHDLEVEGALAFIVLKDAVQAKI